MRRNLDIDNFISPAGNLPARPEAMKPVTAVKKNTWYVIGPRLSTNSLQEVGLNCRVVIFFVYGQP